MTDWISSGFVLSFWQNMENLHNQQHLTVLNRLAKIDHEKGMIETGFATHSIF